MAALSRAAFLRANFNDQPMPLRPPWALPASRFADCCDGCGDCLSACPQGIVVHGPGRLPEVDFSESACTFCGDCADACPTGALVRRADAPPWSARARVGAACLGLAGIHCRTCEEACTLRAIRFRPRLGGRMVPEIDTTCTGCGACHRVCPVDAIDITEEDAA